MLKFGQSNSLFRGEKLKFILKVAKYLEMKWVEIKTDLLVEDFDEASIIINRRPEYPKKTKFSVHASYRNIDLAAITDLQIKRHERDLDFAKEIGADRVTFHVGYSMRNEDFETNMERIIEVIEHYLDYTEGLGIKILIENTKKAPKKLCSELEEVRYLLEHIDHDRLRCTLDVINLVKWAKKKSEDLDIIKNWIEHIHINSTPVDGGYFKSTPEYVKFVFEELEMKEFLQENPSTPIILEGKTSIAQEMYLYHELNEYFLGIHNKGSQKE